MLVKNVKGNYTDDKSLRATCVVTKEETSPGSNQAIHQHEVGDVSVILPHPAYNHDSPSRHPFNNLNTFYFLLFSLFLVLQERVC